MSEQPDELKKLVAVATDMVLSAKLRTGAIDQMGKIGSHDALVALLELAAKEQLTKGEREFAVKHAMKIIKSGR